MGENKLKGESGIIQSKRENCPRNEKRQILQIETTQQG
jgi:hypothetical protein